MNMSFYSQDIDECRRNLDNCHENAVCTNTEGSYTCTCNRGFTGDGFSCTGKLTGRIDAYMNLAFFDSQSSPLTK